MSDWVLALIHIEMASKWAMKDCPEIYSHLELAMKVMKEKYGDPPPSKWPRQAQKNDLAKKSLPQLSAKVDAQKIDFSKPPRRIGALMICGLCSRKHIGCKKYYSKSGASVFVCINCEAAKLKVPKKRAEYERSSDMLDYTVSGSYGSGKRG